VTAASSLASRFGASPSRLFFFLSRPWTPASIPDRKGRARARICQTSAIALNFGEALSGEGSIRTLPGQVFDAEAGWFYNWHRDYKPALGRYDQFDPMGLGGGINGYGYVGGNPLSRVDPRGLYGCKMVGSVMVCDLTPPPLPNPDYPVYPQNPSLVPQWLNDWSNTFNQARDNLVDKITDKACKVDEKEKECEAQWEAAEHYCNRLYGRGYRPSPDGRGIGGMKWQQCVKGQVDEACGGNKVEH
jgi:RHS repeat-associated protein